jgi:cytidylate kinase
MEIMTAPLPMPMPTPIAIAIDGPSASGKGTLARGLPPPKKKIAQLLSFVLFSSS